MVCLGAQQPDEAIIPAWNHARRHAAQRNDEPTRLCLVEVHDLSAPLCLLVVGAVASNFVQVKALFAPEIVKPKFDKLNPVNGFKGISLVQNLYRARQEPDQVHVVFWVLYSAIKVAPRHCATAGMPLGQTQHSPPV